MNWAKTHNCSNCKWSFMYIDFDKEMYRCAYRDRQIQEKNLNCYTCDEWIRDEE